MLINRNKENTIEHVKFISYTGKYPNLCRGDLTLEIDGEKVIFGSVYDTGMRKRTGIRRIFWHSGGYIDHGYTTHQCEWQIDVSEIPEEYRQYASEIDEVFNSNVPYGCCGGCI